MSKYAPDSNTLQSKFGFRDEDLKTPKHDEIILWLDENMKNIVYKILDIKEGEWDSALVESLTQKATSHVNERILWVKESIRKSSESTIRNTYYLTSLIERNKEELSKLEAWQHLAPSSKIPTIKTTWEYPIKNGNFLIGFVDMLVNVSIPCNLQLRIENAFLPYWDISKSQKIIIFEAKSTVPSLGEVVRQIRMYEAFIPQAKFIIVSPDNRFEAALKSQGIGFVKYES